jgi:hypothetical protein
MHITIQVLAVIMILLIAFIVLVGLMIGWTGETQNAIGGIFDFFSRLLPGS